MLECAHVYKHSDISLKTNKDNMMSVFCIIIKSPEDLCDFKYIQYNLEILMHVHLGVAFSLLVSINMCFIC